MFIDLHQDVAAYFYDYLDPVVVSRDEFLKLKPHKLERRGVQVSLPALQRHNTRFIVAACFPLTKVNGAWSSVGGRKRLARQFEIYQELEKQKLGFEIVRNKKQFERIAKSSTQPIGLIIQLEGCDGLSRAQEAHHYLKQEVKVFSLTWNLANAFAGGLWTNQGLTKEGQRFIEIIDEAGAALDLVHLHPIGVRQALAMNPRQVMVSHTALKACCRHLQNLSFSTIEQIVARNGVIGFAFLRTFYSMRKRGWEAVATLEKFADELDVFKERFGSDHFAVGSDYGGYPYQAGVVGAQNIQGLTTLRRMLNERGWSKTEVEKLFFLNAKRFLGALFQ